MDTKQNAVTPASPTRDQVVREDSRHPEHLDSSSSAEIKQRIDRTRGAMDSTLNQLGERLSPHSLLDDAMEWFKSSSAQNSAQQLKGNVEVFGKNLGTQIRDNPLPALLIGAGLAWMAFGSSSDSDDLDDEALGHSDDHEFKSDEELLVGGYGTAARSKPSTGNSSAGLYLPSSSTDRASGPSMVDKAKQTGSQVATSLQQAASSTAHSLHDAATAVGDKVSEATAATARGVRGAVASVGSALGSASETTQDMAHRGYTKTRAATRGAYSNTARSGQRAGRNVRRAGQQSAAQLTEAYEVGREKLREAHEDYPLALGFGFLALGALAGLAIPRTRKEDELLGDTSDQVRDSAWEAGEEIVQQGKEAVDQAVSTARHAAEDQGLTPDNLASSASRVLEKTANTLNEAAKEEGIHPKQLSEKSEKVADKAQASVQKEVSK